MTLAPRRPLNDSRRSAGDRPPASSRLAVLLVVLVLLLGAPWSEAGELAVLHRHLNPPYGPTETTAAPLGPGAPAQDRQFVPLVPPQRERPVPDIGRVGLERTGCYGQCPIYTVVILADGTFTYTGERYVERLGEQRGTVPRWLLDQVLRYVAAIDYLELDDTYTDGSLDTPTSYTLVEWGGTTKVVLNHANSAPATVWALERLIDDLLELADWE